MTPKFEDGQTVRIKETGEVVTISHWFVYKNIKGSVQYKINEYPGTWFSQSELEAIHPEKQEELL